jgi:hypothetical protein
MHNTILSQHSILVPLFLPYSHCILELCVFLLGESLCYYISRIFLPKYIGVVDDLASMVFRTVMVLHINVFCSGIDHCGSDMYRGTLIVTVDWQLGCIAESTVNILVQL